MSPLMIVVIAAALLLGVPLAAYSLSRSGRGAGWRRTLTALGVALGVVVAARAESDAFLLLGAAAVAGGLLGLTSERGSR